ncbi:DUF1207 domain-containing protein [Spirosoma aureum]|uniref:DUF1207 domain-containing protein n=1 Tax=Spirosoma aureum TaxID=2692134 RepID=A0A6G9AFU3_9BACT|nr:DUF1207 domain-containing protein [Spirosoma aureum]QIP11308.1 DUF1207 domain-containing protein [Spirosoma aureum]
MKKVLLAFLLSVQVGTLAFAQQPTTPAKTTAPASRTLTPAEQRQKEKIDREVQRERQIRAEWAQKQREYEAKQAEKERQKQARKAEKERQQQERETAKSKPEPTPASTQPVAPPVTEPVTPTPAPTTTPAVVEPTRKEKRAQRKKEAQEKPAPAAPAKEVQPVEPTPVPVPVTPPPVETAPVEAPQKVAKPQRPKRERKPAIKHVDSVAVSTEISEPSLVRPRREFLPKGHLFEPILLDPLEAQTYGSVLPLYYTDGEKYKGSIVPFAFGFAKAFYRRTPEPGRSTEWVLDLASFTQFEAFHDDKLNKARRQIMNNDYKISIIYNVRRGANNYRFRVYHISSHLGDDYIYRNKITAPSPNSVNYEQLDATYSRNANNWRLYAGAGIVLRKTEERKLLSAQLGAFYKKPSEKAARLVGGVDIKFWQQTDFRPGIHAGIGLEVGRTQNNLTFLLEGYSGFRPYSQYESQQTNWLGIGLYLNPF